MFRYLCLFLIYASAAAAHAPVLSKTSKTADAPFVIEDAEHSKAIYAVLNGEADYYRLNEDDAFAFYAGIMAAKLESCDLQTTFSFEVLNDQFEVIDHRDGTEFTWWPWYEKFGKQWYWIGPEIGADFKSTSLYPAGTYYIRVFNQDNTGKYVLAIGDKERFGLKTLLSLRKTMRETEAIFWDESACD